MDKFPGLNLLLDRDRRFQGGKSGKSQIENRRVNHSYVMVRKRRPPHRILLVEGGIRL